MGLELDRPVINERALANNFTNEIGAEDKVRFLRNIAGLWLVQECRRAWSLDGSEYSYAQLTEMAASAEPFAAVIHPDAFLEPGNMPQRIAANCRKTGQAAPGSPASTVRVILESLALRYRQVLENLESVSGQRIEVIHIVGGGSKNGLLNQLVAEATGRDVIAGPTEATAAGNILVQAMGAGVVEDLAGLRQVVRNSFPLETYKANAAPAWDRAYEKYLSITSD
jgi:rhamnulokinase